MTANSDNYRTLAEQAMTEADAAKLDNVRERWLRSAAAWQAMADRTEKSEAERRIRDAAVVARLAAQPA